MAKRTRKATAKATRPHGSKARQIAKGVRSARRVTNAVNDALTAPRMVSIDELVFDDKNACHHGDRNRQSIRTSLKRVGAARSIVVNARRKVLAGNGVLREARDLGYEKVLLVPTDGKTLVAVERSGLSPDQETELALHDNHTARLGEWDGGVLGALAKDGFDLHRVFHAPELASILSVETTAVRAAEPSRSRGGAAPTEITAARAIHLLKGVKRTVPLVHLDEGDAEGVAFVPVKKLTVERLHQFGDTAAPQYLRCTDPCPHCGDKKPVVEVVVVE